ncbi:exosortase F system-associated protein [Flavobacterium faecale]|uniref:Exosortase F system-associated protein n=1 Tax=Flavobacterium faecale TaxID=1355330 RepID=A0A2S1L8T9_9FLAO|nr:exosortase F system-associated protein [Flavobacterium faecale]AWG20169.1 exosortase F system-associated protein [Flavobacterium faecale]
MLKKIRQYKYRILLGGLAVFALILIRVFERVLFYDPFLHYFELEFNRIPLPTYDSFSLFLSLTFRYVLNSVFSLLLIYIVFKECTMIKFALVLYAVFFLVLMISMSAVLHFYETDDNFTLFYIRRFLIQPIFVLLFIPAFYYQRLSVK